MHDAQAEKDQGVVDDSIKGKEELIAELQELRSQVEKYKHLEERLGVDEQLQDTRGRLQAVMDAIPVCVSWIASDLKYRGINKYLSDVLGMPSEQVSGKAVGFVGSDPQFCQFVEDFFAMSSYKASTVTTASIKGKEHNFLIVGQKFRKGDEAVLVGLDVTELNRSEKARARLATALEQATESIIVTDTNGKIEFVNPAFERITGYSREEVIGKNPRIIKSGKHDTAFYREMWETISGGGVWNGHLINKCKDGALIEEDVTISPVRDSSGQIINFVAVKHDVTQKVALEAQLRQAQKMEAVGQLAGGVAHDFNNLLQAILGYTQMSLAGLDKKDRRARHMEQVLKTAERAADLTQQLLAFSRRQVLQLTDLNLNQVVEEMIRMLERVIGEDIELQLIAASPILNVNADRGMIEQVIMNLAVNARDAMPSGGQLIIETRNVEIDENFCKIRSWAREGKFVLLSVSDNGLGMSPDVIERIYEPFFTTKDVGDGTGLGLSLVYGIVKQHDGMIDVYSHQGKGTTFNIYLPAVEGSSSPAVEEDNEPAPGGTETILLAEDEEVVRDLTTEFLTENGYTVLAAKDGEEALHLFNENHERIDLALLDVVMPKLGGRALSHRIKAKQPELPVLFCSGYSPNVVRSGSTVKEEFKLIQKPYELDALLWKIREVLDTPA